MTTPVDAAQAKLDAALAKVEKLEAHLAGARTAVAEAQAELEAALRVPVEEAPEHSGEHVQAHAGLAEGTGQANP